MGRNEEPIGRERKRRRGYSPTGQKEPAKEVSPESPTGRRQPGGVEWALQERVKELRCLYAISELAERHRDSLEAFLQAVANVLPEAWQFPESACARVRYGNSDYRSPGFRVTPYRQAADIMVNGSKVGEVEVYYTKKMPRADEGPFLKEERDLINAVAQKVGSGGQRIMAEAALRNTNAQLEVERKALREANTALRIVLSRIEDEKRAVREAVVANVGRIIMPILHALEMEIPEDKKGYITLLRRNLEEIASPFHDQLSKRFMALTPSELQVCNMIQMGLGSKEIARLRHISPATVSRQRESIRKKLGLTGKGVNLVTYLQTFTKNLQTGMRIGRFSLETLPDDGGGAPQGPEIPK